MTAIYQNRAMADAAVDRLKAYAQPQRLMILSCLLRGERTVSEIDAATRIGQPALSQQLAELRRADLVSTRKEAKSVHYALTDAKTALCVRAMEAIFAGSNDPAEALTSILGPSSKQELTPLTPPGAAAFARVN